MRKTGETNVTADKHETRTGPTKQQSDTEYDKLSTTYRTLNDTPATDLIACQHS